MLQSRQDFANDGRCAAAIAQPLAQLSDIDVEHLGANPGIRDPHRGGRGLLRCDPAVGNDVPLEQVELAPAERKRIVVDQRTPQRSTGASSAVMSATSSASLRLATISPNAHGNAELLAGSTSGTVVHVRNRVMSAPIGAASPRSRVTIAATRSSRSPIHRGDHRAFVWREVDEIALRDGFALGIRPTTGQQLAGYDALLHRCELGDEGVLVREWHAFAAHGGLQVLDQRVHVLCLDTEILVRRRHVAAGIPARAVEQDAELLLQRTAEADHVLSLENVADPWVVLACRHQIVDDPADPRHAMKRLEHRIALERAAAGIGVAHRVGRNRIFSRRRGRCLEQDE